MLSSRHLLQTVLFTAAVMAAMSLGASRPATAGVSSGTVSVSGSVLTYTATAPSVDLTVSIETGPDRYRFAQSNIAAGAGCVAVDIDRADCNLAGISTLNIGVAAGSVRLEELAAADTANVTGTGFVTLFIVADLSAFGAVNVATGAGQRLDIQVNDNGAAANTAYTLTSTTLARAGFGGLTYTGANLLYLTAFTFNKQVNVNSTAAGTSYAVNTGPGDDTFTIGSGDIGVIEGHISLAGSSGTDALVVNDSATAGSDAYTVGVNSIFRNNGELGQISHNGMDSITLDAEQGANSVHVSGTFLGTPVVINGNGGNDSLAAFPEQSDYAALMTFNGGGGSDDAEVNYKFRHPSLPGVAFTLNTSSVSSPAFGGLNYSTTEALAVTGSSQDDTFTVDSMAAALSLDGLAGADTFLLANGTLNTITSSVSVNGGADADALTLRDQTHPSHDTYTYTRDSVDRPVSGQLNYVGIETMMLNAGPGNNTINIGTTEEGTANFINSGAGNDAFFITAGGIGIAASESTTLDGGTHTTGDSLTMYDGGLAVVDNGSTMTASGRQPIHYSNIENPSVAASFDTDGDGCSDTAEGGANPTKGGDRNPLDPWDFFDLNANKNIDLNDALLVLEKFGLRLGDGGYDPLFDRMSGPPHKPWRTAPATGNAVGIDLLDVLANLASFGHNCV